QPGQEEASVRQRGRQEPHPRRSDGRRHRQELPRSPRPRQDPHLPRRRHHSHERWCDDPATDGNLQSRRQASGRAFQVTRRRDW
ncbi:hypothetical protein BN1708_020601, partial [Verticillium longisporum]